MRKFITLLLLFLLPNFAAGQTDQNEIGIVYSDDTLPTFSTAGTLEIGFRKEGWHPQKDGGHISNIKIIDEKTPFKKAFEETFPQKKLFTMGEMHFNFKLTFDDALNPVAISFYISGLHNYSSLESQIENGSLKSLAGKIMEYVKFEHPEGTSLKPDTYYTCNRAWSVYDILGWPRNPETHKVSLKASSLAIEYTPKYYKFDTPIDISVKSTKKAKNKVLEDCENVDNILEELDYDVFPEDMIIGGDAPFRRALEETFSESELEEIVYSTLKSHITFNSNLEILKLDVDVTVWGDFNWIWDWKSIPAEKWADFHNRIKKYVKLKLPEEVTLNKNECYYLTKTNNNMAKLLDKATTYQLNDSLAVKYTTPYGHTFPNDMTIYPTATPKYKIDVQSTNRSFEEDIVKGSDAPFRWALAGAMSNNEITKLAYWSITSTMTVKNDLQPFDLTISINTSSEDKYNIEDIPREKWEQVYNTLQKKLSLELHGNTCIPEDMYVQYKDTRELGDVLDSTRYVYRQDSIVFEYILESINYSTGRTHITIYDAKDKKYPEVEQVSPFENSAARDQNMLRENISKGLRQAMRELFTSKELDELEKIRIYYDFVFDHSGKPVFSELNFHNYYRSKQWDAFLIPEEKYSLFYKKAREYITLPNTIKLEESEYYRISGTSYGNSLRGRRNLQKDYFIKGIDQ